MQRKIGDRLFFVLVLVCFLFIACFIVRFFIIRIRGGRCHGGSLDGDRTGFTVDLFAILVQQVGVDLVIAGVRDIECQPDGPCSFKIDLLVVYLVAFFLTGYVVSGDYKVDLVF